LSLGFSEAVASMPSARTRQGVLERLTREQLDFAVAHRRVLVTFNVADFVREARAYADEERDHCGIIVSDQLDVGELAVSPRSSGAIPLRT
jgi:hypothetical protein